MCLDQERVEVTRTPKSLCESTDLIGWLLMEYVYVLGGEDERENRIAAHLVVFKCRFQVEHHEAIESRSCCIRVDSFLVEMDFSGFVSSVKRYVVQNEVAFGMSLTKIRNSRGPRTLPWGTPD